MERAKSAQKIAHHSQEGEEFGETRTRSFQENFIAGFRRSSEVHRELETSGIAHA